MFTAARRVAAKLKPDPNTLAGKGTVARKGVIVSYASGRATITVGGDNTPIPNCPCVPPIDGVAYTAGDIVQVLQQPPLVPTVLCKLT